MTNEEIQKKLIDAQNAITKVALARTDKHEPLLLMAVELLRDVIQAIDKGRNLYTLTCACETELPLQVKAIEKRINEIEGVTPNTLHEQIGRMEGAFREVMRDLDGIRSHMPANLGRRLVALEKLHPHHLEHHS